MSSVGNFFSDNIIKPAVNTITAPVKAIGDIASGNNVFDSIGKAATTVIAGNPVVAVGSGVIQATGAGKLIDKVPVLGQQVNQFTSADVAINSSGVSKQNATTFYRSGGELSAETLGALAAAPAVAGASTGQIVTGGIVGGGVLSKLASGQAPNLGDVAALNDATGDPTGLGDVLGDGTQNASGNPVGSHITPSHFVGPITPTGTTAQMPSAVDLANQTPSPAFIAMLGLGAYAAIHAIRKGHLR